jgi:hypothetical protein
MLCMAGFGGIADGPAASAYFQVDSITFELVTMSAHLGVDCWSFVGGRVAVQRSDHDFEVEWRKLGGCSGRFEMETQALAPGELCRCLFLDGKMCCTMYESIVSEFGKIFVAGLRLVLALCCLERSIW